KIIFVYFQNSPPRGLAYRELLELRLHDVLNHRDCGAVLRSRKGFVANHNPLSQAKRISNIGMSCEYAALSYRLNLHKRCIVLIAAAVGNIDCRTEALILNAPTSR